MKPHKVLFFFLAVGLLLAVSVLALPDEGVEMGPFTISMPTTHDLFGRDTTEYVNVDKFVAQAENIDSLPDITDMVIAEATDSDSDTVRANADELIASIHKIQFANNDPSQLFPFFKALDTETKTKKVRILHYGDSQIEGDRMTSFIRDKLQKKFGGMGPGLLPAKQPYNSYWSIKQSNEGKWYRHAIFIRQDTNVKHKNYGALAAYSRFAPLWTDTITQVFDSATIDFKESKTAYYKVRKFQHMRLFYGNVKKPMSVEIYINDTLVHKTSLKMNVDYAVLDYKLGRTTKNMRLEFRGVGSPDLYGISLDGNTGVCMDNIGLRGSSGTFFARMDYGHTLRMLNDLDPDLVILQFGGNVMPYIKDYKAVQRYGKYFYSQLARLNKMRPNTAFVVIGPSDMSMKNKDKYVTYPFLPYVRDALKKAAFDAGMGYWDMFEAMGGANSMPAWVMAEPALAGKDYVHFTPKGSKVVANMFYNALMLEYTKYSK
jgi:lysophospholipase L1-like esterase